jgi:hypothetical protein
MNTDKVKLTGRVNYKLYDESGNLKDERSIDNLVVTAGKNFMAAWLAAASQAGYFMQYVALGTGTTPAQSTDTGLETELSTRVAGTVTSSTNVWQNVAVFGAGVDTGAITEAGLFSASSGPTMLARQVFSVINKAAGDSMTVTWQITIS